MSTLLVFALVVPLLASFVAAIAGTRRGRMVGWLGVVSTGAGFVAVCVVGAQAAMHQPVSATWRSGGGALIAELSVDRLSALLLFLVFSVSTVVQLFAVRYLACDTRSGWFTASAGVLTAASAGLMTSETLLGLAVCWSAAGAALCFLLATFHELPAARDGVARTAKAFLIGDAALWCAVALMTARWGNVELSALSLEKFEPSTPLTLAIAVLIVVAALSRSAQIPFHRWLPATLAAPTPVSALLHAGVVNAGGVLLVRLSPVVSGSSLAMGVAFAAGTLSMVYGALVMLTKPDIKGSLVYSTMAQMGFMILTCGLGLSAAAVFHLVGHGFYKATLFLASGSAVAHRRRKAAGPPAPSLTATRQWTNVLAAIVLPAAALVAASTLLPVGHDVDHGSAAALLIFAWATVAAALGGWLARCASVPAFLAGATALLAAAVAYVGLIGAVTSFFSADLPPVAVPKAAPLAILGIAVLLAGLALLRQAPATGFVGRAQQALYARALSAGYITAVRPQRVSLPAPAGLPTVRPLSRQLTGAHQ